MQERREEGGKKILSPRERDKRKNLSHDARYRAREGTEREGREKMKKEK